MSPWFFMGVMVFVVLWCDAKYQSITVSEINDLSLSSSEKDLQLSDLQMNDKFDQIRLNIVIISIRTCKLCSSDLTICLCSYQVPQI